MKQDRQDKAKGVITSKTMGFWVFSLLHPTYPAYPVKLVFFLIPHEHANCSKFNSIVFPGFNWKQYIQNKHGRNLFE